MKSLCLAAAALFCATQAFAQGVIPAASEQQTAAAPAASEQQTAAAPAASEQPAAEPAKVEELRYTLDTDTDMWSLNGEQLGLAVRNPNGTLRVDPKTGEPIYRPVSTEEAPPAPQARTTAKIGGTQVGNTGGISNLNESSSRHTDDWFVADGGFAIGGNARTTTASLDQVRQFNEQMFAAVAGDPEKARGCGTNVNADGAQFIGSVVDAQRVGDQFLPSKFLDGMDKKRSDTQIEAMRNARLASREQGQQRLLAAIAAKNAMDKLTLCEEREIPKTVSYTLQPGPGQAPNSPAAPAGAGPATGGVQLQ